MNKTLSLSLSLCVIGILLSGCGALSSLFKSDNGGSGNGISISGSDNGDSGSDNDCEKHLIFWQRCMREQINGRLSCSYIFNAPSNINEIGATWQSQCINTMDSSADFDFEFFWTCVKENPKLKEELDVYIDGVLIQFEDSCKRRGTGGSGTPSLPAGTTTQNCQNLLNRSVLTPFRSCIERTARQITCNNWESQLRTAEVDCGRTVDSLTFMMNCPGILHAPHLRRIVASKEAEFRAKCD